MSIKERLGTSRLNDVFLKIFPYGPISKFKELEIGTDLTFIQSKMGICKADFCKLKKCEIKTFAYKRNSSLQFNCENVIMGCSVGF